MSGGGGGEGGDYDVSLNLTAMLDVISNLLFFLMFSFAAQQSAIELDGEITLPTSSAELPPKKAINVAVGRAELLVEKDVIATIKNGKVVGTPEGRIEALHKKLAQLRQQRAHPVAVGAARREPCPGLHRHDVLAMLPRLH